MTDQVDLARGVLEVAWAQHPGDRTLKRARRRLGLSTVLDDASSLPWNVAFDPSTLDMRDARAIDALLDRKLERDVALDAAAAADAERRGLAIQIASWLDQGDARIGVGLVALRDGGVPADPTAALARLREELDRYETDKPDWLPNSLAYRASELRAALAATD